MNQHALRMPPSVLEIVDVAPGIKWLRLPLPFRLNHINVYLVEDGDGWTVIDAGIYDPGTVSIWCDLLDGPLAAFNLKRLIVTHHHPDHIGMAGWLCERTGIPLLTSLSSYLMCKNISLDPSSLALDTYRSFYMRRGLSKEIAERVGSQGHIYLKSVSPLPPQFFRLMSGDALQIGSRRFRVITSDGHAPEQVMLYCQEDRILFAGDQVMLHISPNVSIWVIEPESDILSYFIKSLRFLRDSLPADTLVLPGHHLPFRGLWDRCGELLDHHENRCDLIVDACADSPKSAGELVPVVFPSQLDAHQLGFAFGETLAHVNRLLRRGRLRTMDGEVVRYAPLLV